MPNYKSYVGVDKIYYSLVTQDDANAYAAAAPAYLAPAMNVAQTPKTNTKVQYADDQPFDTMSSEGESDLDVEITGLPLDVLAVILGRVHDAATGRLFDNGGTAPYVALGFRSQKSDGEYRYYWFLKGQFAAPPEEQATKTDTPDPKSTKLKFTAIRTIFEFDLGAINDSVKRVVGDTADAAFVEGTWFDNVQVPVVGSPAAFTVTPVPADGASGVAVGANIVLTFSNPLAGDAEDGIALFNGVTLAVKATVMTLNAARTIVTLDPTTNMTAATLHQVVINGVVDIYGQALTAEIVDFTTA